MLSLSQPSGAGGEGRERGRTSTTQTSSVVTLATKMDVKRSTMITLIALSISSSDDVHVDDVVMPSVWC